MKALYTDDDSFSTIGENRQRKNIPFTRQYDQRNIIFALFHIYNFGTDRIQKMLTNVNGSKNLGSIFGTAKSNTVLPRHSASRESYHDLHNAMAL